MQAIFLELGIAPTRDTKAIRRAYAQRLKALDQHTQAEAFEALRTAYETALNWAAQADAPDDLPDIEPAAPVAGADAPPASYAPQGPQQTIRQAPHDATLRVARERRRTIDAWITELMHTRPQDLPAAWQRLRADPALESLDSMADLGDRLLERIAEQPDGQYALYSLAEHHFHWDQAAYRPRAPQAADWLQRYAEERELWERQPHKQRLRYERAIERMRRRPTPNWRQASQAEPAIYHASRHMPLWWSLHVPGALAQQYARTLQSPPRLVRGIRKLQGIKTRWPKWYVWLFVGILAHGLTLWLNPPAPAPSAHQANPQVPPAETDRLRQVTSSAKDKRTYLITGPVAATSSNGEAVLEIPIPVYPEDAQDTQGTVQVTLTLNPTGEVQAAVTQSSGTAKLDAAALAAAQGAHLEGRLAYAVHARLPFSFRPRAAVKP